MQPNRIQLRHQQSANQLYDHTVRLLEAAERQAFLELCGSKAAQMLPNGHGPQKYLIRAGASTGMSSRLIA
jgi:hypothetical protein